MFSRSDWEKKKGILQGRDNLLNVCCGEGGGRAKENNL